MKLPNKLFKKRNSKKADDISNALPTNDTLEDHRKDVLKKGKKHSRPLSDTQQKVVITSTVIAFLLISISSYLYIRAVYFTSSTTSLVQSASKIIPTQVAGLNGDYVQYDELIFQYNTAKNVADSEGAQLEDTVAFSAAIKKTLENKNILQLSREQEISVSNEEVVKGIEEPIILAGGEKTFDSTIEEIYGWTRDDFKKEFRTQLLRSRIVTEDFYSFSQHVSADNFQSAAQAANIEHGLVEDIASIEESDTDLELVSIFQNLQEPGSLSKVVYGEAAVYVVNKIDESSFEYATEGYQAIEDFIDSRLQSSKITICLKNINLEDIDYERKSWHHCIRQF